MLLSSLLAGKECQIPYWKRSCSGPPVVATDIPPNRELMDKVDGSILVAKGPPEALYNGLLI